MSKIIKNHLLDSFIFSGSETVEIANAEFLRGEQSGMAKRGEIDGAALRLAWLLQHILFIVSYNPPFKYQKLLEDLAKKQAGEENLDYLAGEITKRFDILTSVWNRYMWSDFSRYNQVIYDDMKAIREAIIACKDGDGGMLLLQNKERLGTIAEWSYPEEWKKNEGMSENRTTLAEKAYSLFEQMGDYNKVSDAIIEELKAKGDHQDYSDDSPEKFAWDKLITDYANFSPYEAKAKRRKYLVSLVSDWKKGKS